VFLSGLGFDALTVAVVLTTLPADALTFATTFTLMPGKLLAPLGIAGIPPTMVQVAPLPGVLGLNVQDGEPAGGAGQPNIVQVTKA
jgi:hypothetical protein